MFSGSLSTAPPERALASTESYHSARAHCPVRFQGVESKFSWKGTASHIGSDISEFDCKLTARKHLLPCLHITSKELAMWLFNVPKRNHVWS